MLCESRCIALIRIASHHHLTHAHTVLHASPFPIELTLSLSLSLSARNSRWLAYFTVLIITCWASYRMLYNNGNHFHLNVVFVSLSIARGDVWFDMLSLFSSSIWPTYSSNVPIFRLLFSTYFDSLLIDNCHSCCCCVCQCTNSTHFTSQRPRCRNFEANLWTKSGRIVRIQVRNKIQLQQILIVPFEFTFFFFRFFAIFVAMRHRMELLRIKQDTWKIAELNLRHR